MTLPGRNTVGAGELRTMDVDALLELRGQIDNLLSEKREHLERQLERIAGKPATRPALKSQHYSSRVVPRYRSKQDPSIQWSGRGMLPRWMKAEMKGTKLKKEDFRIP